MRPSPPSPLVVLASAALLSACAVAACQLDSTGLGAVDARVAVLPPDAATTGAAGTGAAGGDPFLGDDASVPAGEAGVGAAGTSGAAGSTGEAGAGAAGDGVAGTGAAGDGVAGTGAAGDGPAGAGGPPDASGTAGAGPPDARPMSPAGCADGTREGFKAQDKYPNVAACAGGWTIPGLFGPATLLPSCERHAGNDGARADGQGCSVADLCAEGWHVCEGARELAAKATDCKDALPTQGESTPLFFATRQRGPNMTCDPANLDGTNNVYGCGNFGSTAMAACAPFTRMLRDADCKENPPWTCVDGPIDYNVKELLDVTKPGSAKGGVLCCR